MISRINFRYCIPDHIVAKQACGHFIKMLKLLDLNCRYFKDYNVSNKEILHFLSFKTCLFGNQSRKICELFPIGKRRIQIYQ